MYQYITTPAEGSKVYSTLVFYEKQEDPDIIEVHMPQSLQGWEYDISGFPRTKQIYFWNEPFFEYLPFPELTVGKIDRVGDLPGTSSQKEIIFYIKKNEVEIVEYSREFKPLKTNSRLKKVHNKINKMNDQIREKHNKITVLQADNKDTKSNTRLKGDSQEGSNHCTVVRPPGKTKSDGYLKQERKPTSATNIFKNRIIEELEEEDS
jgi:hypothetical protein